MEFLILSLSLARVIGHFLEHRLAGLLSSSMENLTPLTAGIFRRSSLRVPGTNFVLLIGNDTALQFVSRSDGEPNE